MTHSPSTISAATGSCRADEYHVKLQAWRFDMRALSKTFLLLLLATFGLASCGGGGGGSQSAFNATPVDSIAISAGSTSITTNSFTILTVSVKRQDGTVEADGTSINATVTPATMGVVSPRSNTLTGGTTTFGFAS